MESDSTHNGLGVGRGDPPSGGRIEAASAGAHSAIESMAGDARPAVDRMADKAHSVVDRLAEAAGNASTMISRGSDQLGQAGSRVTSQYRRHVAEHPLTVIGIAALAGFLISRLMRSR